MQYETCRHVKEDGAYCGSPALRERKYCYYHLMQRGRRLRRARALRDNLPYRLEIQSLDNLYAVRDALSDIAQAPAAGQLESRTAGKLLYAIQQVSSTNRRIEQMEAAQLESRKYLPDQPHAEDNSRVQECPEFEAKFGLPPGADLDAVTDAVLQKADEEAEIRQSESESIPTAPPGVRVGSPAYHLFREEGYQMLRLQVKRMQHELREFNEQKRQQFEKMKKEMMSATPAPDRRADSA